MYRLYVLVFMQIIVHDTYVTFVIFTNQHTVVKIL